MNQIIIKKQQHSLTTIQDSINPVKEVSKPLEKKQYTAEDLMGLSWTLFEEDFEND